MSFGGSSLSSSGTIYEDDDLSASNASLTEEEDPVPKTFEDEGAPAAKALEEKYVVELQQKGRLMADYLRALLPFSEETRHNLETIRLLFDKANVKGTTATGTLAEGAWRVIQADARTRQVLDWADRHFIGNANVSMSWPQTKELKPGKFRLLYSMARSVKYIEHQAARAKYKIEIRAGLLYRGDAPFDTYSLFSHFASKRNYAQPGEDGGVIWVLGEDDSPEPPGKVRNFYSHVAKIGRIHHSSFFGGNAILCGGDWKVRQGKVEQITGRTGHYHTPMANFLAMLHILRVNDVIKADEPVIKVWGIHGDWISEKENTPAGVLKSHTDLVKDSDHYQLYFG